MREHAHDLYKEKLSFLRPKHLTEKFSTKRRHDLSSLEDLKKPWTSSPGISNLVLCQN